MRLKYLLFPVAVVIAVCIFIMYAWPEFANIRTKNEKILENREKLQEILKKREAVEKMGSMINQNQSDKQLIENYLPSKRVEEKIISNLNFLATDSGVALVSLNLKSMDFVSSKQNKTTAQTISDANKIKSTLEVSDDPGSSVASSVTGDVKYTEANMTVSGDYAKIKIFLGQIQRMQLFNNVKSISISKPQTGEPNSSSNLLADVVMDFGHMEMLRVGNQTALNFSNDIDSETILALKKFISEKSTSVLSTSQAQGKANPFQP